MIDLALKERYSVAQRIALGEIINHQQALKGRHNLCRPFRACKNQRISYPARCAGLSNLAPSALYLDL